MAQVFAEAADRQEFWVNSLKGWNMRESTVVNGWIEEGRVEGRRVGQIERLEAMLTTRFGPLSDAQLSALRALPDDRLRGLSVQLLTTKSLAELGL